MSDKAKYIGNKETTLLNDLDKVYKKLRTIADWYYLSSYSINNEDEKNQKLYIQKINNLYHEMKNLIIASKNTKILKDYERLIIQDNLSSLDELNDFLLYINRKNEEPSKDEYNLSFHEAVDLCLNNNDFIIGENFKKGYYAKNQNGVIVLTSIQNGYSHEVVDNLMISKGILNQKFKVITCVNSETLNIK